MFWNQNYACNFHVNDNWKAAEFVHEQVEYFQMFGFEIHRVAAKHWSGLCVCVWKVNESDFMQMKVYFNVKQYDVWNKSKLMLWQ